jgi:chloramphenicol-sensitive protein RarD
VSKTIHDAVVGDSSKATERGGSRAGLLYGLTAYTMWGFIPLYFRAVAEVSPGIILCHRIMWSVVFLVVVVSARKEWSSVWPVLRKRRSMLLLGAGSVLIAGNWLLFIFAVSSHQVLQASLGYFITPLLSIVLGMVFLNERPRGWQWLAVSLAAAAIGNLMLRGHDVPWISLALAGTFGFYALVRKMVDIDSLLGLLIETSVLLPFALAVLAWPGAPKTSTAALGILSLSGLVTALPLLCFGAAVRRLTLTTMGFLQYVGPTLQFLVAFVLFRESLTEARFASFLLCWLAIAVYALDSILARRPQILADEPD